MKTCVEIGIGGVFTAECYRNGDVLWVETTHNILTDEGLDHTLDVTLHGKTLIDPFYCVLSETDTTASGVMTYAVPVFTECETYDEVNRPEYEEDASSSQSITNSSNKATFTMNASKTIYAAALMGGSNVKGDSTSAGTHVLLCYAKFGASRAVVDDDVINLTYTVSAADDAA